MAYVVAVEDVAADAAVEEFLGELVREGGLAGGREAGEPDDAAAVAVADIAVMARHEMVVPDDVVGLRQFLYFVVQRCPPCSR